MLIPDTKYVVDVFIIWSKRILYLLKYFSSLQAGRELKNKNRNTWPNYGRTEKLS